MKVYEYGDLPDNLKDVARRIRSGAVVYGFELQLLADYVSQW